MINSRSTLLKVAELYYIEKKNQNEIAKKIGVSRPTVSRMLEEAREIGIIKISIELPFERNNSLATQLRQHFNLKDVIVVKDLGEYKNNIKNVGQAAADYISNTIYENTILGISWGTAVEVMVDSFPRINIPNANIIQLNGSLGSEGRAKQGNELSFLLSEKLGGSYEPFNAPAYVDNKELQEALNRQPQISKNLKYASTLNIAYGGIGNLEIEHNTLVRAGILNNKDLSQLKNEGAVGTMLGRAFNIKGDEVELKDHYPMASELDVLRTAPISIGAVASEKRARAVFGAISGKLINVLICDEKLAESLLNDPHPSH